MSDKITIEHNGKTLVTSHFFPLPDDTCNELRMEYYRKPNIVSVMDNLQKIEAGGSNVSVVTSYYVKELMSLVKLYSPTWSISEVFENNDLIRYFWSRVLSSEKVYPKHHSNIRNFETALRLSGGGVAMKPSNFPIETVDEILERFNTNGNYYDFSCGWGTRLLSALRNNVNYFGTDPNFHLIESLKCLHKDYDAVNSKESKVDIRCVGSEVFQADWVDFMGIAFSSPPYFSLEDYRIGSQSYSPGVSYMDWLGVYLAPTILNIKKYLINDGYFLINIKDFKGFTLTQDTRTLIEAAGFIFLESMPLKNITRPSAKQDLDTDESIMVFQKVAA